MDNNILYQGFIQTKTKIIPIISILRPSKYNRTVIQQQPYPAKNVTKSSDIILIHGDDDMVQHIIPINKSGPQGIYLFGENNMSSNMHTINHA